MQNIIDINTSIGILVSILVYLLYTFPKLRKQAKLGLLMAMYIRDISNLLIFKLSNDWSDISIPRKLDVLKAVYDMIDGFDDILKLDKPKSDEVINHEIISKK